MKTAAVLSAVALAAAIAVGTAFADGLPTPNLPGVPTPTVSVPTVSIPPVSVPQLPVSTPTTPTPVATPMVLTRSAPSISVTAGGVGLQTPTPGTSTSTSGASSASTGSSSSASQSGPPIARFRSSRSWLAQHGPANRRHTILNFRLPAASRVVFSVTQVAPVCRAAGHFAVAGKEGLNRVVFRGRVNGRDLAPGTYKVTAHVPGKGSVLHVVVVVIDSGMPSPSELALARRSDVCSAAARGLASSSAGTVASGSGTRGEAAPTSSSAPGGGGNQAGGPTSGTAGESFTAQTAAPFSPERVSQNVHNPLVIFALAASILLLGLAALPKAAIPDPRLTDVLVRHRVEVALAGAAALTAALIALALA